MTSIAIDKISAQEYLSDERKSEPKNEFVDGIVIPMTGASLAHTIICMNVSALIWMHIREKDFTIHSNDLRVYGSQTNSYFYPDIVVIKGEAELTDEHFDTITNPLLIVEVLSESTEGYDRGNKFRAYREIDTLKEYVLISQDKPGIEIFLRNSENIWTLHEAHGLQKSIHFNTIDLNLSLSDIYYKINF